ncbi:HAMP domain-containing histidine kinase [bacterium]|nr:HAMP domain-containing histidine kinase [bacterium]
MSIFYRLWLSLAVTLGLVILALGVGEYKTLQRALNLEVDHNLEKRAHWIQGQLLLGLLPKGLMLPDNHPLEEMGKLFVEIYDARGQLLQRSANLEGGSLPGARQQGTYFETVFTPENHPFRIYQLRLIDGREIRLGESLELAYLSLSHSLLRIVLLGTGGFALAALISRQVLLQICGPLTRLALKAGEIASVGNVAERLPTHPSMVTEVRVVSETINLLLARVQELLEAQSRLLQDTSHELRNPLTVLQVDLDLLLRSDLDEQTRAEIGQEFRGELTRLIRLVEDLLSMSWAETQTKVELRPVQLDQLVERVMASYTGRAEQRSLQMKVMPCSVLADPDRLEQILRNLLDNAFRYAGASARIGVDLLARPESCQLVVWDDGPGISREHWEPIFERFYRLELDRNRAKGGTGLGLPVARALARAMGGDLWIESEPGQGTRFHLKMTAVQSSA